MGIEQPNNQNHSNQVEQIQPGIREGYMMLMEHDFELLINEVKERVKQWHNHKPDYVFLNETSAVAFGYLFKEAWKVAYPDEKLPLFYRIDPRALGYNASRLIRQTVDNDIREEEIYKDNLEKFIKDRIKINDGKIVIFDEHSLQNRALEYVKDVLIKYAGVDEKNIYLDGGDVEIGRYGKYFDELYPLENMSRITSRPWPIKTSRTMNMLGADEVKFKADINRKVQQSYNIGDIYDKDGKIWHPNKERGRRTTWSKSGSQNSIAIDGTLPEDYFKEITYVDGSKGERIEKSFKTIEYIRDLKKAGREAGEKLRAEIVKADQSN